MLRSAQFSDQFFTGKMQPGAVLQVDVCGKFQFLRRCLKRMEEFFQIIQKHGFQKNIRQRIKDAGCNVQPETIQSAVSQPSEHDIIGTESPVIASGIMEFCNQGHIEPEKISTDNRIFRQIRCLRDCCVRHQFKSAEVILRKPGHNPAVFRGDTEFPVLPAGEHLNQRYSQFCKDKKVNHFPCGRGKQKKIPCRRTGFAALISQHNIRARHIDPADPLAGSFPDCCAVFFRLPADFFQGFSGNFRSVPAP